MRTAPFSVLATKQELTAKAAELRKTLAEIDRITGRNDTRAEDAARKREQRQTAKLVIVPRCEDRRRRELLEADDVAWLMHYFAEDSGTKAPFTYQFTSQQMAMIEAIRNAIISGGDQAIAASRGEGKTTLCERMLLKYTLTGRIGFSVLFAATGSAAEDCLESIKTEIEENDRLAADYPEVCTPVRALDNTPNRAHYQIVSGDRHDNGAPYEMAASRFSWCGQEVYMPNVPGSPCAGSIIATRGLDSAVRGVKKKGRRVDVAIIDDPDTEETARSEEQAKKLEDRIDRTIAALGSQRRRVARVMLTTLQNRICASYRFTSATDKPSWNGKRFRFLERKPDRLDLWDEYITLRRADYTNEGTTAMEFYRSRREEMDAGAAVANENRYTHAEISALQFYFNEVARLGADAVATEYDNDPPEEVGPIESGISSMRVQRQVSGYPRGIVPDGCTVVTQGIDCKKTGLHWVVRAWMPDATGFVIDYGFHETHGTTYNSDVGVDVAIKDAILGRIEVARATEYKQADGTLVPINLTLIDGRYRMDAVYSACMEIGLGVYPVLGFGKSAGCWRGTFTALQRRTNTERPGDNWNMKRDGKVWVVHANADHWKAWEHDRWMSDPHEPCCMKLFGVGSNEKRMSFDELGHHAYSRHIVAEVEVEEMVRGVLKRYWKPKPGHGQNHYLDASYYSSVAGNILGVRLPMTAARKPTRGLPTGAVQRPRMSLAEMAKQAR